MELSTINLREKAELMLTRRVDCAAGLAALFRPDEECGATVGVLRGACPRQGHARHVAIGVHRGPPINLLLVREVGIDPRASHKCGMSLGSPARAQRESMVASCPSSEGKSGA